MIEDQSRASVMHKTKVVLASGNKGKIRELQHQLGDRFELISQSELDVVAPEETGLTFLENALIKARAAAKQTGLPAIADDSGLAVDYLNGAPGIYSARYSGSEATDEKNNAKLLQELEGVAEEKRKAYFHCALVFMQHHLDPTPIISQASWHGRILIKPSGTRGFGYDPLFYVFDQKCASAELSAETKNKVSHRGQAIDALIRQINKNLAHNKSLTGREI